MLLSIGYMDRHVIHMDSLSFVLVCICLFSHVKYGPRGFCLDRPQEALLYYNLNSHVGTQVPADIALQVFMLNRFQSFVVSSRRVSCVCL